MDQTDPLSSFFATAANGAINALVGQVNQATQPVVKQKLADSPGTPGQSGQGIPTWAMVAVGLGAVYLVAR